MKSPSFSEVRSEAGAIAADSTTINLTNYPFTKAFQTGCRPNKIAVYWDGTGATPADWVDLQVLIFDGTSVPGGQWIEGQIQHGVTPKKLVTFDVGGASTVYIRVAAAVVAAATLLKVYAVDFPTE